MFFRHNNRYCTAVHSFIFNHLFLFFFLICISWCPAIQKTYFSPIIVQGKKVCKYIFFFRCSCYKRRLLFCKVFNHYHSLSKIIDLFFDNGIENFISRKKYCSLNSKKCPLKTNTTDCRLRMRV